MSKTEINKKFREEPKTTADKIVDAANELRKATKVNKTMLLINLTLIAVVTGMLIVSLIK